jgi:hypothetical protein
MVPVAKSCGFFSKACDTLLFIKQAVKPGVIKGPFSKKQELHCEVSGCALKPHSI